MKHIGDEIINILKKTLSEVKSMTVDDYDILYDQIKKCENIQVIIEDGNTNGKN